MKKLFSENQVQISENEDQTDDENLYKEAKKRILKKLSYQAYHSVEIKRFLHHKGIPEPIVERIIEELQENCLINDTEWVEGFIRNRLRKKWSFKAIRAQLFSRGIDSSLEIDENQEARSVRLLIQKKFSDSDFKNPKQKFKISIYLRRKGFSSQIVQQELNKAFVI